MLALNHRIEQARQLAQREAYGAHIARQSAQHHADSPDLEYNARTLADNMAIMVEERAESIASHKRRLELDCPKQAHHWKG